MMGMRAGNLTQLPRAAGRAEEAEEMKSRERERDKREYKKTTEPVTG